jgi:hypothetical protein
MRLHWRNLLLKMQTKIAKISNIVVASPKEPIQGELMSLLLAYLPMKTRLKRRHDTEHDDIPYNGTQHKSLLCDTTQK